MRICRIQQQGTVRTAFYFDESVVPVDAAARLFQEHTHKQRALPAGDNLLDYLSHGTLGDVAAEVYTWGAENQALLAKAAMSTETVQLLAPIARPDKIFLLAGNYAAHVQEGGEDIALERAITFPYVFMKPLTALNHPGADVVIPAVSPDHVDWEAELGIIIGRACKGVSEAEALDFVAGYTVVNDVSDRKYRPNPGREERPKDGFFDWLHGKWHDGFCPMGPCAVAATTIPNPQTLPVQLRVNGELKQDGSTAQQVYPVAAVIAFIARSVTLMPGDIISTGTPAGVGMTTGTFLKPGDVVEVSIEGIGVLVNRMVGA